MPRKLRITVLVHCTDEGEQRSKSASPTRAAGCFQRLRKFKGVESVLTHKTGLEKGQSQRRFLQIKMEAMQYSQSENVKIRVFMR